MAEEEDGERMIIKGHDVLKTLQGDRRWRKLSKVTVTSVKH
jgi:hypothetical protein